MHPKLRAERNLKIAELSATGKGMRKISEELTASGIKLTPNGVKRVLAAPEIKAEIERLNRYYIDACLPGSIEISRRLINKGVAIMRNIDKDRLIIDPKKDNQGRILLDEQGKEILGKIGINPLLASDLKILDMARLEAQACRKAVGIEQGPDVSVCNHLIINDNSVRSFISPAMQPFIDRFAKSLVSYDLDIAEDMATDGDQVEGGPVSDAVAVGGGQISFTAHTTHAKVLI